MPADPPPPPDDEPDHEGPAPSAVVGIGASAGGLKALDRLLDGIADDTGIAWVVVVHLSPEHDSHLAELLQRTTSLPVQQVVETVALRPDTVYVIPPNANLNSVDTHLRLSPLEDRPARRAPIDHFFRTLARTHDGDAIGVVLTGTGSDGTLGLREIREKGGLTLAQDPAEAEYGSMPQSAVAAGFVDVVATLDAIPGRITDFTRARPRLPQPAETETGSLDRTEDQEISRVLSRLKVVTGRDFTSYKQGTVLRRLRRRMQLHGVEELADYYDLLESDRTEVTALADDLLITVTSFFRDPDVFERLEEDIVPDLFDGDDREGPVRAWSVGCATGEEAYSLAMLLLEQAPRSRAAARIKVFATDLHEQSLATARTGIYPATIATDVEPERIERHFEQRDGGYRVKSRLRDLVVFSPHDLLSDPPFSRLDLIVCRNLLIYLEREMQRDVMELFHYSLRPGGTLVLGSSESIDGGDLFEVVDKDRRIYRRRRAPSPEPRLPVFPLVPRTFTQATDRYLPDETDRSAAAVHRQLIEQHAPPSLLVTKDDQVVHLSDDVGHFLSHPGGEPTTNVVRLIREELRGELRAALHEVRGTGGVQRTRPAHIPTDGNPMSVTMEVRASRDPELGGFALVVFHAEPGVPQATRTEPRDDEDDTLVTELQRQLRDTRGRFDSMAEQQIVAEEELRAANEELQSSNEELRSTLEEIETGKEELQSINEELETVNEENRHKVEELSRLSSDLQNLLVATDIATLFLDRQLRIMRFTPRVADLFSIRAADRGRPLSDITQALDYDRLQQDAQEVLKHLTPVEREVRDQDGNWYLARVLPYRSHDDRIEGVVLTFVDITRRRLAEQRYRTLFESIDEGFCIIEVLFDDQDEPFDYRFIEVNPAFESQTGLRDAAGRTMRELAPQHEEHWYRRYGRITRTGEPERFEDHAEQLEDRWFDVYAFPIGDPNECRVAALFRDVTARRRAEQALRALTDELERRVVERTREVRQLSDTLALTEQQERARLSQVLHDDLQQLLYGIQMQVAMARDQAVDAGMDGLVAATRRAMDHLDDAINRTRQLTVDLSPPILEDEGLADAIEWLRPRMLDLHGLELDIRQERDIEVTSAMRVLAFQVVRELVFNVAKHAEVDVVQVVIDGDDGVVRVSVEDDGVGFDVDALHDDPDSRSGLGLRSARERLRLGGARLEIESSPGEGTRALLLLPAAGAATDTDSDPDADRS